MNNYISLYTNVLSIIRKGGIKSVIRFSDIAKKDLQEYLKIRKKRYKPVTTTNALFLPSPEAINWKEGRLSVRAIQKLVEKYAHAFGRPLKNLRFFFSSASLDVKKTSIPIFLGVECLFCVLNGSIRFVFQSISFNIRLRFTANMVIAPCISMPSRPEDVATSYPCPCLSSLFFASIL